MTTGIAISLVIAGLCGVLSLWLILRFLQHVYDRGGRADLTAASTAVRKVYDPQWLDRVTRFLPAAGASKSDPADAAENEIASSEGAPAIEGG